MQRGRLAFSPEVRRQQGNYSGEWCWLLEEKQCRIFVMPIHPLSNKGAFESPVSNISRLASGDTLFQRMNSINILSFFPGRNASGLRACDLGIWGTRLDKVVKWAERRWCWCASPTDLSPLAAVLCVTLGLPPSQPHPCLSPDPITHVGF